MLARTIKRYASSLVLVAGILVTVATSAPENDGRSDEDTRVIEPGETVHVVLRASQVTVDHAEELSLTLWYESADGTSPEMRIIPDAPTLGIETGVETWTSTRNLMPHCPRQGECILGFSVELTDETQSVELHAMGLAWERDTPTCITPTNPSFPEGATLEVFFDDM